MATKRKRRRSRKGAGKPAPFLFARAKRSAPQSSADPGAWREFAKRRAASDPLAQRRRMVEILLLGRDVYPEIAYKVAYTIDPERFYLARIYGYKSSDPNDDGAPGDVPVLRATYVASGERLWERIIGYAGVAPIEDIDLVEISPSVVDRPLWGNESVVTVEGERVYGHGNLQEYRDRQKVGRPKKSGGGKTAKTRRKERKAKDAAIRRKNALLQRVGEMKAKAKKLAAKGNKDAAQRLRAEADRLLKRSEKRRKVIK